MKHTIIILAICLALFGWLNRVGADAPSPSPAPVPDMSPFQAGSHLGVNTFRVPGTGGPVDVLTVPPGYRVQAESITSPLVNNPAQAKVRDASGAEYYIGAVGTTFDNSRDLGSYVLYESESLVLPWTPVGADSFVKVIVHQN
jgi:hypothetical protein